MGHKHACLEVKFGFKSCITGLTEGSLPVILISLVLSNCHSGVYRSFCSNIHVFLSLSNFTMYNTDTDTVTVLSGTNENRKEEGKVT